MFSAVLPIVLSTSLKANSEISPTLILHLKEALSWFAVRDLSILIRLMSHWFTSHCMKVLKMASHSRIIHLSKISGLWLLRITFLLYRNIIVRNSTKTGFIAAAMTHSNMTFEDFYINNVTFTGEEPFLYVMASRSSYYDAPNDQTTLSIKNGVLQNMLQEDPIPRRVLVLYCTGFVLKIHVPVQYQYNF